MRKKLVILIMSTLMIVVLATGCELFPTLSDLRGTDASVSEASMYEDYEDVSSGDAFYYGTDVSGASINEDKMKNRKVIIDTDGLWDDCVGIAIAAKNKDINLLGITTTYGDLKVEKATDNITKVLTLGKHKIDVYKGASNPLEKDFDGKVSVFGKDGLSSAGIEVLDRKIEEIGKDKVVKVSEKSAEDFIIESVKNNPDEIELCCLGSMTNIAKAIIKDRSTMKKVKRIWTASTQGLGTGDVSPVAESNVYKDIESYKIVLESGIDITVLGMDMINQDTMVNNQDFLKMERDNGTGFVYKLMCEEAVSYYKGKNKKELVPAKDAMIVAAMINQSIIKESVRCIAEIVSADEVTKGMVVFYKEDTQYINSKPDKKTNVALITKYSAKDFKEILLNGCISS